MPSRSNRCSSCLLAVGAALVALGCQQAGARSDGGQAPVPVLVEPVRRADVPVEVHAVGTVEASSTVEIVPQVAGRVLKVHFAEGAVVKTGDPLFLIDTRPYTASLAAAQAELARNQALAEHAAREAERYERLVRDGLASAQEAAAHSSSSRSSAAAVEAARAEIASARLNVQYATIRAPIAGRTGKLLVHAGNVVSPNDRDPMVVIRTLSPCKVSFPIKPDVLPLLRARFDRGPLGVQATPRGTGARTAEGVLSFVDNAVDPGTGMLTVKATFPNPDEALWPGSFVDVVLGLDVERQVLAAPESAVAEGQKGPYVFVIEPDHKARLQPVKVARRTETLAIVSEGLKAGDRVVVDGIVRLRDGTPVTVKAAAPPQGTKPNPGAGETRGASVPSPAAASSGSRESHR